MNIRRITSLTALISFIIMTLTSVILYIVPQGRIAYWADYHLMGLTKEQWGYIHINVGFLFLISIFLHIYYNWKPLLAYLKDRAKRLKIFTKEFNVALIITAVMALGTYFEAPPFFWIIDANTYLKDRAAEKYGEPPYGHAELSSLQTFIAKMGYTPNEPMDRLKQAGVKVTGNTQTLAEIAEANNMTPQQVFLAMKPPEIVGRPKTLPETPPPGLGKRPLADVCQEYDLNIPMVLRALADNGVAAKADMSIRDIAEAHNAGPVDIYDMIRKAAAAPPAGQAH